MTLELVLYLKVIVGASDAKLVLVYISTEILNVALCY